MITRRVRVNSSMPCLPPSPPSSERFQPAWKPSIAPARLAATTWAIKASVAGVVRAMSSSPAASIKKPLKNFGPGAYPLLKNLVQGHIAFGYRFHAEGGHERNFSLRHGGPQANDSRDKHSE